MRKIFQYIAILGIILILPSKQLLAQNNPTTKSPEKGSISSDKNDTKEVDLIDQPSIKDQPLSSRKQKVELSLNSLINQFNIFYTRTQNAVDRLAYKNIEVGPTQNEIDLGIIALNEAKINLALFSKITISDKNQEKTISELKISAKKTEENLRESRLRLVNALTSLKITVTSTVKENSTQE